MQFELNRLEATAPPHLRERIKLEFDGFQKLFQKFLQDQGPSVVWEQIQKLPEGAVSFIFYY